jgi:hypothetical protein
MISRMQPCEDLYIRRTLASSAKVGLQCSPTGSLILVSFPQQVPSVEARPVLNSTVDLRAREDVSADLCSFGAHTLSLPTVVPVNFRVSLTVGWRISCDARAAIWKEFER